MVERIQVISAGDNIYYGKQADGSQYSNSNRLWQVNQIIKDVKEIIDSKCSAKQKAQSYKLFNGRQENLMGIKNKAKLGNL